MKRVAINNTTYTEVHAGQTLARCTPSVDIILADVLSPSSANDTANVAANTPIYFPVGKATFIKANTTNATLNILE